MGNNIDRLTPLQQIAYTLISEITETKHGAVEPCMAHISEIRNALNVELMEALRGLCRKGILSVSLDINKNAMFQIKNPID